MKRLIPGVEGANTAAWRFTNPASARRSDAALEPGSPPQLLDQAISTASAGFPGLVEAPGGFIFATGRQRLGPIADKQGREADAG
jgi:hypothetical protein